MSEDTRSTKRRRIASHHDPPTPSKSANARARNTNVAAGSNKKSNGDELETPSKNQSRGNKKEVTNGIDESPIKKSSFRNGQKKAFLPASVAEDDRSTDELANESSDESDGEPRKSVRQRKPSAKLLFIQKDITEATKPRKAIEDGNPRSAPQSAAKRKEPISTSATPAKPAKLAQSTPSKTPKRRGRPPKIPVEEEPRSVEEPDPELLVVPFETPKKRGRPPGSTNKPKEPQNVGEPEPLMPFDTPKKRGRPPGSTNKPREPKDVEEQEPLVPFETPKKRGRPPGSTNKPKHAINPVSTPKALRFDVPPVKTNGISYEEEHVDVEMIDDVAELEDEKAATKQKTLSSKLLKKFGEGEFPLAALSKVVLEKIAQRRPVPLIHLDEEYSKVHTLLESTITAGEGNSMLVVGARGSGKTALVNKALSELNKTQKQYFHVVRLNGFIQTDDKLALREIWRQLGREMEIDEDASKSYADTLTMLLALLSHPDEIAGEAVDRVAKSIIIIMDEFDLFATHARQTLLYNLLDIAQSRKAPIAVLGLTTKFDVTERLEKRVKSRFSHRYVHLPLSKSLKAFQDVCKAAVTIEPEELSFDEQVTISQAVPSHEQKSNGKIELSDYLEAWNASVNVSFLVLILQIFANVVLEFIP
jgi:origin recognition complex subunit 4